VADGALNPAALLGTLSACGVDFVVIGALAVGVHAEVRATGDVDVMLPIGDEANRRVLRRALEWARDLAAARAAYFDPSSRVWIAEDAHLHVEARRSDLTDRQIEQWALALADRLNAAEVIADTEIEVQIQAA
jgi:hypothetical protein